jgi:hypothetical protein
VVFFPGFFVFSFFRAFVIGFEVGHGYGNTEEDQS